MTPYRSDFSCPPTYSGICASPIDAYNDSVNDIDPRQFDPRWQKKRKKWEEKNKELLEARKQAALKKQESSAEAPNYRAELFRELRDLIEAPETPVVIPPKIVRALVLGTPDGKMYVAPHYVFFMLDEPRWVLRKIPERLIPASFTVSTSQKSRTAGEVRVNAK
ncbi:TraV family lipoprotein [Thermodesulfatator indicus]|nr:TraV family lipoprotein [Thermodesulfatator indicus]